MFFLQFFPRIIVASVRYFSVFSLFTPSLFTIRNTTPTDNKQLLDEVEHDIMNYQNRGLFYLPKPKAEADNTDTRF